MNDEAIQFHSRVGDDGVLNFHVNLGPAEAKKEVVVTIEPAEPVASDDAASLSWHDFIERTYGSCASQGLERHDQGQFETREPLE
jgi:hypothetical protein